jgi:flavin reductase (DIM6/NTAB) family NADH-FMN oxidoreductase RutF
VTVGIDHEVHARSLHRSSGERQVVAALTARRPAHYSGTMSFDPGQLRRVMGFFATGVTIITTRDQNGRPYGLTANAVTSLSLEPPLLLICVDRKAETFPHFFDSKIFVLNILAEDQEQLSRRFATTGGDKFTGLHYHLGRLGTPILEGTLGHIECRIIETLEGGDHVIHVGEVEEAEAHDGRPLVFFRGKYRQLDGA